MDTVYRIALFCVALFMCFVSEGSAISCYDCDSNTHGANCTTTFAHPSLIKDCNEKDTSFNLCRRIEQWVDTKYEGLGPDHRIIRKCGKNQTDERRSCYYRAGLGGRQHVCTCYSDSCNTGYGLHASFLLLVTAVPTLLLISRS